MLSVTVYKRVDFSLQTNLLVTNGELALSLLVGIGESLKLLDGFALHDLNAELDVALGVLVARLYQTCQQVCIQITVTFCLRRPWCHRAEQQESRLKPCASPRQCPQRIGHNLIVC